MKILLAEDDAILADALTVNLQNAGFEVETVENGVIAEYLLTKHNYALAILDIGLPMMDGLSVLRKVRQVKPNQPIIILTALCDLEHRVEGLNAGADDYLTKPFEFPELEARVRSLLRRAQSFQEDKIQQLRNLVFDREAYKLTINNEIVDLSPREWSLLDLLLSQHNRVVTKEQILQTWNADKGDVSKLEGSGGSIEVYIHRLRKKIEPSGLNIRTVRGLGYLLEEVESVL